MDATDAALGVLARWSADQRVAYLFRCLARYGRLWGLYDGGWASVRQPGEGEAIMIWPLAWLARAYARRSDELGSFAANWIGLGEWRRAWLPGMARDGTRLSLCPLLLPGDEGCRHVFCTAQRFGEDFDSFILSGWGLQAGDGEVG